MEKFKKLFYQISKVFILFINIPDIRKTKKWKKKKERKNVWIS